MPETLEPDKLQGGTEATAETPAPAEPGEEAKPKIEQTVSINDVGPCKKHIKVEISRKTVDDRLEKKYKELVSESTLPGFRPGKAPRALVIRHFQKEISNQLKAELLLESLEQMAEEHKLSPLAAPDLDPYKIEFPKSGPMLYEFDIEVRPEFDLPNYKGLKLRRPVKEFTDEDVKKEQQRILANYGSVDVKSGGADIGDVLVCQLISFAGDRQIGEIKETNIKVQPQLAFKDGVAEKFAEQVKGVKAGESRSVDVTLSDSVADQNLRGQKVTANLQVKQVYQVNIPELTPEFLEGLGVRSPEQFEELTRVVLKRRLDYTQRQEARRQIMERFTTAANWDLPADLLRRQARKTLQRQGMEMRANGMSDEEIEGRLRLQQQDVLQNTAASLKEHFVLQKIAEVENIDVTDDDIEAEIERLADQSGESYRKMRARIEKEEMLDTVASELVERRALDLILESAEYEDYNLDAQPGSGEQGVSTVEGQAVEGQMQDPTATPPSEQPAGEKAAESAPNS